MFYCDANHILWGSSNVYCYIVSLHVARMYKFSAWTLQYNKWAAVMWGRVCCLCPKLMQGILQRIKVCPSNNSKKACIKHCDANNSTLSLSQMYYHTATESLYRLLGVKNSWTPNLGEVFYRFGFICFSIFLQCKICRSSGFSIFFP